MHLHPDTYLKNSIVFILVFLTCGTTKLNAQAGTLDLSFGDRGKVVSDFKAMYFCLALQGDKIIAAGGSRTYPYEYLTARYNAKGNLDSSFGENGIVKTNVGGNNQVATDVAIQQDGKIVEVGSSDINNHCILIRYLKNGKLDDSFGEHGVVNFRFRGQFSRFNSVVIQPDGKIICAGEGVGKYIDFLIYRFNTDGTIDSSFAKNGVTRVDFDSLVDYEGDCILLPNGKILVVGNSNSSNPYIFNLEIVRLLPNGQLDKTFGHAGKIISNDSLSATVTYMSYRNIGVQSNGRIIAGGYFDKFGYTGDVPIFKAFKYNGEPDSSFGINGVQILAGSLISSNSLQIEKDDKLICAGIYYPNGGNYGMFRLLPGGTVDSSFGHKGSVITTFTGYASSLATGVVLQNDNKIIVCGRTSVSTGRGILARYNNDLSPSTHIAKGITKIDATIADNNTGILLYPNPVKNVLNVEGLHVSAVNNLFITDATGRIIATAVTGNAHYAWNVQRLNKGIYYLHIECGGKANTVKFVKE